jgi:hypothetical protein
MCKQKVIVDEILSLLPEHLAKRAAGPLQLFVDEVPSGDGVIAIEVGMTPGEFFKGSTVPLNQFAEGAIQVVPVVASNDPELEEDDDRMTRLTTASRSVDMLFPDSPLAIQVGVAKHVPSGKTREVFDRMVPAGTEHLRQIPTR